MSLMLRKACQSLLNNNRLGDYHVRVQEDKKYMEIVGPCGQPLFAISGIRFGKTNPSAAEISYAVELLEEFLLEHKTKIEKFFEAKAIYSKNPVPVPPEGVTTGNNGENKWGVLTLAKESASTKDTLTYTYPSNLFEYQKGIKGPLSSMGTILKDKKRIKELTDHVKAKYAYDEKYSAYIKAKSAVQTCNI